MLAFLYRENRVDWFSVYHSSSTAIPGVQSFPKTASDGSRVTGVMRKQACLSKALGERGTHPGNSSVGGPF